MLSHAHSPCTTALLDVYGPDLAEVFVIATRPDMQHKGMARALMAQLRTTLAEAGGWVPGWSHGTRGWRALPWTAAHPAGRGRWVGGPIDSCAPRWRRQVGGCLGGLMAQGDGARSHGTAAHHFGRGRWVGGLMAQLRTTLAEAGGCVGSWHKRMARALMAQLRTTLAGAGGRPGRLVMNGLAKPAYE